MMLCTYGGMAERDCRYRSMTEGGRVYQKHAKNWST